MIIIIKNDKVTLEAWPDPFVYIALMEALTLVMMMFVYVCMLHTRLRTFLYLAAKYKNVRKRVGPKNWAKFWPNFFY